MEVAVFLRKVLTGLCFWIFEVIYVNAAFFGFFVCPYFVYFTVGFAGRRVFYCILFVKTTYISAKRSVQISN